jgi:glycosyltransferase involved in cell wall biosynthesis
MTAGRERAPRVALLSTGPIAGDPRIRRVGDALAQAGMQVHGFGLGEDRHPPVRWPVSLAPSPDMPALSLERIVRLAGLAAVRVAPGLAKRIYLRAPRTRALHAIARQWPADVYVANDWPALPLAVRLAEAHGSAVIYDSHELATDEMAHLQFWRLLHRPYIAAIERQFIGRAARVVTVSPGIAEILHDAYALDAPPLVVRNMPPYRAPPERSDDPGRVTVLYHGLIVPNRGLEQTVESVAGWRPEFRLLLRGPGSAGYIDSLRKSAERLGVADRVTIEPPVALTELVERAAEADIGIMALPPTSRQNVHALPNKIFEYAMAGLALCVTDLPDMSRPVREFGLGRTIPAVTPQAIAQAINGFDRATLGTCQARAREAARTLNWETESRALVDCIVTLASRQAGAGDAHDP